MALVVPQNGEGDMLRAIVAHTVAETLHLRLYINDVTPAETDTTATFTNASFSGYGVIQLTGANWTITEGSPSSASYAEQSFTRSLTGTPELVYGYTVNRTPSNRLAWAERFADGPYSMGNDGDTIKITPTITLD